MIDVIKQTPREFSSQSRDYQVIARLYTALFNYVKMHIDNMNVWDVNIDNKLAMLRSKTLNFEPDHSWDLNDLESITTCFKYLVRIKGTSAALKYCIDILMRIENIVGESIENAVTIDNYNVTVRVPEDLVTLGVVEDLVKYLLPIGLTYNIVKYRSYNLDDILYSDLYYVEPDKADAMSLRAYDRSNSNRMFVGNDKPTSGLKDINGNSNVPNQFIETFIYSDKADGPVPDPEHQIKNDEYISDDDSDFKEVEDKYYDR